MDTPSTVTMASSSDDNVTTDKQQSRKQFIPQLLAAFAAFSMGTVEAYTSPGMPSMVESPKLGNISSDDQTQIAAIALLAAVLSGPQVGFLVGRIGICLWLLFFQQMTGIEVILIFTVYIFQSARVRMDPNICTIIVGFVQIVATFMSALLVDKAGRRLLLIVSQLGVSVAMMALLIFFHYQPDDESSNNYSLDWVPLTSVCIFMTFFSIGAGPIPFLMLTELNSPAVIGLASSVATTLTWTFAYLVTTFFMTIQSCIGIKWCFGLFCGMSLLGAGFVFVWVPETRAKSMEEIQNYFRKKGGHAKNIGGAGCPSSYHDESHNNNNNTGIIRSDVVT
ncbi:Facilitated trehalose transporter Tret1 [Folsomia candida]|uniref:Facilitated trehalose transporter Tret1 n=1 Tax=Folsomia candida TaxID=158441 RepID=A0A226E043_FOLCA|nr:Facilitated trehalose transporter Tret1 [Folsomia candida]